jgi:choline dehydrogenase-like flavoprotein
MGKLGIILEQELNPDSRVMLGDEVDAFGQRRMILDWRLTERDIHTMRTAAEIVGRSLAARGYGRLKVRDWLREEPADIPQMNEGGDHQIGLYHHLCTTRMSEDPRTGVVDRDCRVHGIDNLHIAGGSVFATAGFANPTYTIVQMALRLGDHLGARLATETAAVSGG